MRSPGVAIGTRFAPGRLVDSRPGLQKTDVSKAVQKV